MGTVEVHIDTRNEEGRKKAKWVWGKGGGGGGGGDKRERDTDFVKLHLYA